MKLNSNDILLFSGDSITEGSRGRKMDLNHIFGHGYQYTVASVLSLDNRKEIPLFINKAYSGYTITRLLETWQNDVISNSPTIISILVGTNDAACGFFDNLTPLQTAEKYEKDFEKVIENTMQALPDIKFIICEPFYFPLDRSESYEKTPHPNCEAPFRRPDVNDTDEFKAYKCEALDLIREKAKAIAERHSFTFVPLYDAFVEKINESEKEYFTWDGTHPTIAGHALIARQWLKYTKDINESKSPI